MLQYNFVTPLTSMVVTKPDEPDVNQGTMTDREEQKDYAPTGGNAATC